MTRCFVSIAKDLLTGAEWSSADTRELLQRTADIKARPSRFASMLRGKHIAPHLSEALPAHARNV